MSSDNVLKLIKEQDVKFVDLRFCDTIGKEQHVTVISSRLDEVRPCRVKHHVTVSSSRKIIVRHRRRKHKVTVISTK